MTTISKQCPNCGYHNVWEIALYNRTAHRPHRNQFESTQATPPGGFVRSLFWFLRGNSINTAPAQRIIVRSEHKPTPHQILIKELEIPASPAQLSELARIYIGLGLQWSRANTVSNSSLSQWKHNQIHTAFIDLFFLDQLGQTRYTLNDAGRRFLRHYLL